MPNREAKPHFVSVRSNLRQQFKDHYSMEFTGSDQELDELIENCGVAPSSKEQDEWRLEDMYKFETEQ